MIFSCPVGSETYPVRFSGLDTHLFPLEAVQLGKFSANHDNPHRIHQWPATATILTISSMGNNVPIYDRLFFGGILGDAILTGLATGILRGSAASDQNIA